MARPVVTAVVWNSIAVPGAPKRMFIRAGQRRIGDLSLARMIANDNPCPKGRKQATPRLAIQRA